ncbi:MAG: hypothetical protein ABIT76_11740 [Chthoniobacterales bacterium]
MKFLVLSLIALLLAGCETDPESRDFFYSGWMHPQQGSDERMYGKKGPPPNEGGRSMESLDEVPSR